MSEPDNTVTIKINERTFFASKLAGATVLSVIGWLILSAFHIMFDKGSPWLNVIVLGIAWFPAFAILIKPKDIQSDADAYKAFARMMVTVLVMTIAFLLASGVGDALTGTGIGLRIAHAAIALPALVGLPLLMGDLILLYRYRARRSVSGLAVAFTYELIGITAIALILPLFVETRGSLMNNVVMPLSGLIVLFGLFLSLRNSWIVNLRKDRKWKLLGYSTLGIITATGLMVRLGNNYGSLASSGLAWFSLAVPVLLFGIATCIIILSISVFFGALIALPTAATIDRRNAEVASLRTLTRLLTGSFELQQLIDTSLTIACDATGAPAAWMEVEMEEGRRTLFGSAPYLPRQQAGMLMNAMTDKRELLSRSVRERKRIEIAENIPPMDLAAFGREIMGIRSLRSVAAIPLLSGNTLLGVLYVAHEASDGFNREDIGTLRTVADQIAVALEHSQMVKAMIERERLEQEMFIAQTIQQRLLPKALPESPLYELYAESQPASIVGGDYYDVTSFSDQTLGIIIADVAGKGAGAALYMGVVKGVVQALAGTCADPRELLCKINATLYGSIDRQWFVTMTCAQIVEQNRSLKIARAGHCPTLLLREGKAGYSRPKGIGLGLAQPTMFEKTLELETICFGAGDSAVFLSDGLPEATSPSGEEFGYERLKASAESAAAKNGGITARELRNEIFAAISTFARGEVPRDDSTIAIIRWQ